MARPAWIAAALSALALGAAPAAPAEAAITCGLDAGGTLEVDWNRSGDQAWIGLAGTAIEVRAGSGESSPAVICTGPPATTSNVTLVNATVAAGGIFGSLQALRATVALAGLPTVWVTGVQHVGLVGGPGDDSLRIGELGVNRMTSVSDTSLDVELLAFEELDVAGGPAGAATGDDLIDASGGAGTGGPLPQGVALSLSGGDGADTLAGAGGGDRIAPGTGDDTVAGGAGEDTVTYADAPAGVDVDLTATGPQPTGGAGSDALSGVEDLTGSPFADALTGDGGPNTLTAGADPPGRAGRDVLSGAGGEDLLVDSRAGDDLAGGFGEDTLRVQNGGDDTAAGGGGIDSVLAGEGRLGGPAGSDVLDGGEDLDTLSYACSGTSGQGVTVDLAATGPQATGAAGADTIAGFENLDGSDGPDVLSGTDGPNAIFGVGLPPCGSTTGVDVIDGRGGDDALGSQLELPELTTNAMWLYGGDGADTLVGTALNDYLDGGPGEDVLKALSGNDILNGIDGGGADEIDCGPNLDRAGYDEPDTLSSCEDAGLNVAPPPPGTPLGTAAPAGGAGATRTIPVPARPSATLPPVKASAAISLPPASRCLSRRRMTVKLRTPPLTRIARAVIRVAGRTIVSFRPPRATTPVSLKGLPRGRYTVSVTVTLDDGRVLRQTRRYRTCARKRKRRR